MSELFRDVIELFSKIYSGLSDVRSQLSALCSALITKEIFCAGASLEQCTAFIDCTKIRITRPYRLGSIQSACHMDLKRMHCLIYQTLPTPDGLMFAVHRPKVGRRHDMTLYHQSGWEQILESCLFIDRVKYYIYEDLVYLLWPWMYRL